MSYKFALLLPALLLSQLAPPAAAGGRAIGIDARRYTITDVSVLASVSDNVALGLGASDTISLWTQDGSHVRASVWSAGVLSDVDSVAGYPNSVAHSVAEGGVVGGWMNTSDNPVDSLSTKRGFVLRNGKLTMLGTLGGRDSRVLSVNAAGVAVGGAELANRNRHAFITHGDALVDLGALPGGAFSEGYAVNAAGDVAGVAETSDHHRHAVLWRSNRITDLGVAVGGHESGAFGTNIHADVVGYTDTPEGFHAFLYSNGRMRDLGTLGKDPSVANGINDEGVIVGSFALKGNIRHAFVWENGVMTDLNTCLPSNTDWTLVAATAINNNGRIACIGKHANSMADHALLLTPVGERAGK